MKQKVFKIGIKHSRSSIPDSPAQKVGQAIKNSLPSIAKRHRSPECGPTFFCSWPPFSIFRLRSAHYVVLSKNASHRKYFFVKTSFNLYPSMFCVEKNKNVLFLALEFTIFSYATWFLYFDFSPAPFLSSKTSWTVFMDDSPKTLWKTDLLLKEHGVPSALSAMPVENKLGST